MENMVGLSGLMSGWIVRGVGGWSVERVGDLRSGWMDERKEDSNVLFLGAWMDVE